MTPPRHVDVRRLVVQGTAALPGDPERLRASLERELTRVLAARTGDAELGDVETIRIDVAALSFVDEAAERRAVATIAEAVGLALTARPMLAPPAPPASPSALAPGGDGGG